MNNVQIINPSVEIVEQGSGLEGIYRMIEKAAKVTTQIEKEAADPKEWVESRLVDKGHMRPLEFGTVYLIIPKTDTISYRFLNNPYSETNMYKDCFYITTNMRVLYEQNILDVLEYMSADNIPVQGLHEERKCVMWNIGRDIADEFRTHTAISSMMESTRYCMYTSGKFNGTITVCDSVIGNDTMHEELRKAYEQSLKYYKRLIEVGAPTDLARKVLPLSVRVHFMQCGFMGDWTHFMNLRAFGFAGTPHPDAQDIALAAARLLKIEDPYYDGDPE